MEISRKCISITTHMSDLFPVDLVHIFPEQSQKPYPISAKWGSEKLQIISIDIRNLITFTFTLEKRKKYLIFLRRTYKKFVAWCDKKVFKKVFVLTTHWLKSCTFLWHPSPFWNFQIVNSRKACVFTRLFKCFILFFQFTFYKSNILLIKKLFSTISKKLCLSYRWRWTVSYTLKNFLTPKWRRQINDLPKFITFWRVWVNLV